MADDVFGPDVVQHCIFMDGLDAIEAKRRRENLSGAEVFQLQVDLTLANYLAGIMVRENITSLHDILDRLTENLVVDVCDPKLIAQVRALRGKRRSPRAIAEFLGISYTQVATILAGR